MSARNVLFAGPVLLLASFAVGLSTRQADGRARLLDDEEQADTRPADTRRSRDVVRDDVGPDRRVRVDIGDDEDRRDARRRDRDSEWFRDPGYYGYGNFPSLEVHDAVVANARAATARALFRRAESALSNAVRKTVKAFENSADVREAQKAEKDAYEKYATARRRALQSVLEDPKYRAIMSLRSELSERIAYKRANRSVDDRTDREVMDDVLALATLKMNYAADARAMEQLALETNSEAKDAQAKLRQAATRVSDLRRDFDDALRNDRDLVAARQNLEDARVAKLTASAYLRGAAIAADEALDFAYYLNRYSRYNGAGYQDYRDYYPYTRY
jgi:hypothetical protein